MYIVICYCAIAKYICPKMEIKIMSIIIIIFFVQIVTCHIGVNLI